MVAVSQVRSRSFEVFIDTVPSGELVENTRRRMHWGAYASMLKEEKDRLYLFLLAAWVDVGRPVFPGPVNVSFRFFFHGHRLRDRDGLVGRLKPILDILGTATNKNSGWKLGVIWDDSDLYIYDFAIKRTVYGHPTDGLRIRIEEADVRPP